MKRLKGKYLESNAKMSRARIVKWVIWYTVLFFFLGMITVTYAQEAIPAAGGNASGNGGSVSYSVGQVLYTPITGNGGSVTQGVQQPYEIFVVTGIDEIMGMSLSVLVYPNPTTDLLTLKAEAIEIHSFRSLTYQLFDMNGRLLDSKRIVDSQTSIDMSQLSPGTYFLKVSASGLYQFAEVPNEQNGASHTKSAEVDTKQMNTLKTFKVVKK